MSSISIASGSPRNIFAMHPRIDAQRLVDIIESYVSNLGGNQSQSVRAFHAALEASVNLERNRELAPNLEENLLNATRKLLHTTEQGVNLFENELLAWHLIENLLRSDAFTEEILEGFANLTNSAEYLPTFLRYEAGWIEKRERPEYPTDIDRICDRFSLEDVSLRDALRALSQGEFYATDPSIQEFCELAVRTTLGQLDRRDSLIDCVSWRAINTLTRSNGFLPTDFGVTCLYYPQLPHHIFGKIAQSIRTQSSKPGNELAVIRKKLAESPYPTDRINAGILAEVQPASTEL